MGNSSTRLKSTVATLSVNVTGMRLSSHSRVVDLANSLISSAEQVAFQFQHRIILPINNNKNDNDSWLELYHSTS